jgi:tRNA A-37 threonylcarbamoyl transferase component Bud32
VYQHPNFISLKRGALSMQVAPAMPRDLIPNLVADPDEFFRLPGCEVIKDQRKIKVARVKVDIQGGAKTVYVKRYNAFSWRYRVMSWFQSSGAVRSLKGAAVLAAAGVRTAPCLAALEARSWGMLQRSFFISEEIPGGKTADAYWQEELVTLKGTAGISRRRHFLQEIGALFNALHEKDIYHNDLKDANILVCPDPRGDGERFYLLDLEGIRCYRKLNRRRRIKNLVQLHRTLGRYLRSPDKLRFLASYLGPLFEANKRAWVTDVLRQSDKIDRLRQVQSSSVAMTGNVAHES